MSIKSNKLVELTQKELSQVTGGYDPAYHEYLHYYYDHYLPYYYSHYGYDYYPYHHGHGY